jgi:hypothetical protein
MLQFVLVLASLASFAGVVDAECANACNGHGKCTSYDMCICNRNWQANDCSERTCQFGLAHVDSPKGDLDMSGALSGPDAPIVDNHFNYPYGTTEQFPQMEDSDLQTLTNSAHYYMECSNKGTCNRATGECQCYDGYDGVSCQRASCPGYPNSCSGHGVCKTIQQLATADHGNVYKLWDKDMTMGCDCDNGYYGPDCSLRECKSGVDPLYLDDAATVRFSTWDFAVLTDGDSFTDGEVEIGTGHWAIRFFDSHGEDWLTGPIEAEASCDDVVAALEALPNNVIPASTISCTNTVAASDEDEVTGPDAETAGSTHPETIWYKMAWWQFQQTELNYGELSPDTALTNTYTSSDAATTAVAVVGNVYRLKFYGNPGKLAQPEIEVHLDGKRPSIQGRTATGNVDQRLLTRVWTDGQQGEDVDYYADHCDGVTVTVEATIASGRATTQPFLTGMTVAERNLLKACLGDSDFDTSNNVDVYNWDHGSQLYPHVIKLVRTVTTYTDGGYYAVLWFDEASGLTDSSGETGTFVLLNPFIAEDATAATDTYDIYTTKGTLALTSNYSEATFGYGSKYVYMSNVSYDVGNNNEPGAIGETPFDGDISCEIGNNNAYKMEYIFHCLNKTDMFTMINWAQPIRNPKHINMYTAERLYTSPYQHNVEDRLTPNANHVDDDADNFNEMHFMTHVITTDISTNWGAATEDKDSAPDLSSTDEGEDRFHVYKFFPSTASQYEYVAECSNRGICDTSSGECKCFSGYTSDSCGEQISVSC